MLQINIQKMVERKKEWGIKINVVLTKFKRIHYSEKITSGKKVQVDKPRYAECTNRGLEERREN